MIEMSFADNPKSKYWSPKNLIKPEDVKKFSHKDYLFDCECGHEFLMKISNISSRNSWCPYCCEQAKKLCNDSDCDMCFERSFASHPRSEFWVDERDPRMTSKACNDKFKFKCENDHPIEISLNNVIKGKWCKPCFKNRMSEKYRHSLETCIERAKEVHGELYDYSMFVKDGKNDKPSIIVCKKHGPFEQSMSNHILNKCGCPACVHVQSRSAMEWLRFLEKDYPDIRHVEKGGEVKVGRYSLDGCSGSIAFEFQGCYIHGCPTCYPDRSKYNTLCKRTMQELYDRTQTKKRFVTEKGYTVIEMWEHDWIKMKTNLHRIN